MACCGVLEAARAKTRPWKGSVEEGRVPVDPRDKFVPVKCDIVTITQRKVTRSRQEKSRRGWNLPYRSAFIGTTFPILGGRGVKSFGVTV